MSFSASDFAGVFAVPPLARRADRGRTIDFAVNDGLRERIAAGGITRLIYGGNAFLYHVTLDEYVDLLAWMAAAPAGLWMIPSVGPSYGRAIDQAKRLRVHRFRCAMLLPCADPRDAEGLEQGAREIAEQSGLPLVLYLKARDNWGGDEQRGLDAMARLMADGVAVAIKYALVRSDPSEDPYLSALLARVDRARVISGIGERPAVTHMEGWGLPGFTTGSGCVAPALCQALFEACSAGVFDRARTIRDAFLPLEDLRDAWGPARVLHAAVELAGLAVTGPVPPYVTSLGEAQRAELAPVARALAATRPLGFLASSTRSD